MTHPWGFPMKSTHALLATAVLGAFLGGCATTDEGPFAWSQGWRKGEVLDVVKPASMARPRFFRCIREADPAQLQSDFLVVKYLQMGRARQTAVPAPADGHLRQGDLVYVNLEDCHLPVVARMNR